MNSSRPFLSESTNVYDEQSHKVEPGRFGTQSLLVDHGQRRQVYDTDTVTISINPQVEMSNKFFQNNSPYQQQQPQVIQGQMQLIPEGVTYTFQPSLHNYALRNFSSDPTPTYQNKQSIQQQIAATQFEKNALEFMLLQEKFKQNPFQLQFHQDCHTDTRDLENCQCDSKPTPNTLRPFGVAMGNAMDEAEKIDIYAYSQQQPDRLFPNSSTQKRLQLSNEPKTEPDQNEPNITDLAALCDCTKSGDQNNPVYASGETQTDRKVSFKSSDRDLNLCRKTRPKRNTHRQRTLRRVDDDESSDESIASTNSKSSEESN